MVTLADVAKEAHVSKMTVSRVINHPEKVTKELQKIVFEAMAKLDYQPNLAARALANYKVIYFGRNDGSRALLYDFTGGNF